ncbi:hypothetical protein [Sphaerisporangium aureirubrum]|uniref:Uncharacterized protein n=1 Tax=Sphaerisporangium aureirubrum TaxID=1544736 RepID=A0ABW1NCJ2_9ACTN
MDTIKMRFDMTIGHGEFRKTEIVDTGIPTPKWDAMTEAEQERTADAEYGAWRDNVITSTWELA